MANEYSGKNLVVKYGGTVLSGDFREFRTTETADMIDATAGADTRKNWLGGLVGGEASMTILDASDGTANWNTLVPGGSGTLQWYPAGTTAGTPSYTANSVLVSKDRSVPYNDVVSIDLRWNLTTAVTQGTA